MARGPFQGTWQEGLRPTVVTAPDAIVYINGRPDLLACNSCHRRFDFNKYVTSISVDLNVENAPGSASVNLSVPRHSVDDFVMDGIPIVSAMMEIEIYAKGFYLVGGLPQYYPIFWGLVTEVSYSYSSGEHTFSISCADILKWWELCRININPAFTQPAGQLGKNYITGNAFNGANVYDIIWTLAQQSFGDVLQAKGSLVTSTRESALPGVFNALRRDIMSYWNARFGQMRSNLLLYGMEGAAVRGDVIFSSQPTASTKVGNKVASSAVRNANGGPVSSQLLFDPTSALPFRSSVSTAGQPNFWQSEYQTKLEIANLCKEAVGFEFYMDVTGDIVFKPPFYNVDILGNKPISWIQDIDIIDWSLSESEAEVVTHLTMSGTAEGGPMDYGITADVNTPTIQVIDYHLLRQFGWRTQSMNAEYLKNPESMFYAGLDQIDRMNARRHRSTMTIPMRPELRLGFPIYIAPLDQIWYISGISHNLTFGGRAQTQLTLTARRGKFIAPKGIGTIELTPKSAAAKKQQTKPEQPPLVSRLKPTAQELAQRSFKVKVGAAAETPPTTLQQQTAIQDANGEDPYAPLLLRHPKTGRLVGYPNVNMVYSRPFNPSNKAFDLFAGRDQSGVDKRKLVRDQTDKTAAAQNREQDKSGLTQTAERDLMDAHMDNRYYYGMTTAGVYTYVHDRSKVIDEIVQIPIANIDVTFENGESPNSNRKGTATIRPVSDERGFEVIGHYRYGRGISLRDGSLVLTNDGQSKNTKATVETQLALSGGLFETLRAQSQGLTSLSSSYGNPADTVARMAPNSPDLQTAAALNPETKQPEFVENGLNFVDTAPLNSPANRGQVATIEVSQLSRALTVAELIPKEDVAPEEHCLCLTGRSDLAFINVGYQVKFMDGTAPERALNAAETVLDTSHPISAATFSLGQTIEKVELFLKNLYDTLDGPHQNYERAIRGELLPTKTREAIIGSNETQLRVSPFSPPFSAPNRAIGGDPAALALQGDTALTDLPQAWKNFGDNLRREPQRVILTRQVAESREKLRSIDEEQKKLEAIFKTGSTLVSSRGVETGTSVGDRILQLQVERAQTQQQLDNAQTKLLQLEAQ